MKASGSPCPLVVMYYTPGQFVKNYTLVQFDETICFFKLMGKMCVCTNELKKVTVPAQFSILWFHPPKKQKSVNRS